MTVLAAFSSGRDRDLLRRFEESVEGLTLHDLPHDVDANRCWLSVSGEPGALVAALERCYAAAAERIDLNRHVGFLPRTGAMEFARLMGVGSEGAEMRLGSSIADGWSVPVFGHEAIETWEVLNGGGFGALLGRSVQPTWGPERAHPQLGISLIAAMPWRITVVLDVAEERADFCRLRMQDVRLRRMDGDPMFSGVEGWAYPAPSDGVSRVLLEFGDPDLAPPDPVIEWLTRRCKGAGLAVGTPRLLGAIRQADLLETRSLPIRPEQIVRE